MKDSSRKLVKVFNVTTFNRDQIYRKNIFHSALYFVITTLSISSVSLGFCFVVIALVFLPFQKPNYRYFIAENSLWYRADYVKNEVSSFYFLTIIPTLGIS